MTNGKGRAKILANKNIGIGMIYGAGTSSIATAVYSAATGDKSLILLTFLEAALMVTGLAKAVNGYERLNNTRPNLGTQNGPSG